MTANLVISTFFFKYRATVALLLFITCDYRET